LKPRRKIGFTVEIGGIAAEKFSKCQDSFLKTFHRKYKKFLSKSIPNIWLEIFSGNSRTVNTKDY